MGLLVILAVTGTVSIAWHGIAWRYSRGISRAWQFLRFFIASIGAAVVAAMIVLLSSYALEGYLVEPGRFLAIIMVVALPITALVGIPFLLVGPRPFRDGSCKKCGYDLRGCVSPQCPECGTPIPASGSLSTTEPSSKSGPL